MSSCGVYLSGVNLVRVSFRNIAHVGVIRHLEFGEGDCVKQISRIQGGMPQFTRYTLSVTARVKCNDLAYTMNIIY